MREENYRASKNFEGDRSELFKTIVQDYNFGIVKKHSKVEIGYEDDNNILETSTGTYFVKIFGAYRSVAECERYIEVLDKALAAGVMTPQIITTNGKSLHKIGNTNLVVFEYIEGESFYQLKREPSTDELKQILAQAARINQVDCRPIFVYDDWAITNISEQYEIVKKNLLETEKAKIEPLVEQYKKLDTKSLPYCFVHGDIISTNAIKSADGEIYIIDFSCSNYCPRIIELAILACNLLRNTSLQTIIQEYEKHNSLTDQEKSLLPLFVDLAHAMHVIGAVRERDMYGNKSDENEYWLGQGLKGLSV